MIGDKEHHIQKRAYEIWEKQGRPHGHDKAHWEQAARELANGGHDGAPELAKGNGKAAPAVSPIVPPPGKPAQKAGRKAPRRK